MKIHWRKQCAPAKTGRGIEKVSYCWALKGKQKYIEKTKQGP
jgi:hypothetical protein